MSVGDVSGVSQTSGTPQTDDTQTLTSSTTIGGSGTLASLPQPLIDAICQSIASSICSEANASQQRVHDTLEEEEQEEAKG